MITKFTRIAIAESLFKSGGIYLALGSLPEDDPRKESWSTNPPDTDYESNELISPLVFVKADIMKYVVESTSSDYDFKLPISSRDIEGRVIFIDQFYKISETPSNIIYLRHALPPGTSTNNLIYQRGIYIGLKSNEESNIITPDKVIDLGNLFEVVNIIPEDVSSSLTIYDNLIKI